MIDLFNLRSTNTFVREKYKMNMIIPEFNQDSYEKKSLRIVGPISYENLEFFKKTIKD